MGDSERIVEKRKERIINWVKNPYNLAFLGVLIFALIIRLYYFFLTQDQALWWDEAEYMNMARALAFGLDYQFLPVRPILFSLITAIFFKISDTEVLSRLFILVLSVASVAGMYYLGKEIYDKKVGLICAFLTSIFYLVLFHTCRLLVDLGSFTFFIFAGIFFYRYLKDNKNKKALYIGTIIVAFGTLFRITTAILLFILLLYLLITERLNFLKKKELWIAVLIFLLILLPYIIWGYLQFNGFVITLAGAWNAPRDNIIQNGFSNLSSYVSIFPTILGWSFLILFILSFLSFYKLIIGFDILIKQGDSELKRDLFLILAILIPIIFTSFSLGGMYEDRYIFCSFTAIFLITSAFIMKTYKVIEKKNKFFAVLLIIMLLFFITYYQINYADSLINNKKDSYSQVKQAGLWFEQNSNPSDIIITKSWPQIMYYSERKTLTIPPTKGELESLIASNKSIKFFVLSSFEPHQDWMYNFPGEKNLSVIQAYFLDSSKQKPTLIIYKLN